MSPMIYFVVAVLDGYSKENQPLVVLEGRDCTPCPGGFLLFNRASAFLSRVQFKIPQVYRVGTVSIALDNRSP